MDLDQHRHRRPTALTPTAAVRTAGSGALAARANLPMVFPGAAKGPRGAQASLGGMLDTDSRWLTTMRISPRWLARRCGGAIRAGLDFEDLLDRSFIPRQEDGVLDISGAQHLLMTLNIIDLLDDEVHGFGHHRQRRGASAVLLCCLSDRGTVGSALDRLVRYLNFSRSVYRAQVNISRRWVDVSLNASTPNDRDAAMIEEIYASFLYQGLCWFAGRDLSVARLQVRMPDHPTLGRTHPVLGVPVVLGDTTAIRLPAACLALPRRAAPVDNPVLASSEHWQSGAPRPVRPTGARDDRNAWVLEQAIAHLQTSNATVDDIAAELGYSESRSLRRLIKSKTGRTPQEWRARTALPGADEDPHVRARARARQLLAGMSL